jgi:Trypsin-like peptidase domain
VTTHRRLRHSITSLFVLALLVGHATVLGAQAVAKDVARRVLPAVVTILTFDETGRRNGLGSGFVVEATGLVVTNFHVIRDAARATVQFQTGDSYAVEGVLEADVARDFAILKVKAVDLPALRFANSDLVDPGEIVFAMGSPLGRPATITAGNFSQFREKDGFRMMQHSAPIAPGNSGGPLVLETGEVIGINTERIEDTAMSFALPGNYVRAALAGTDGKLMGLASLTSSVRQAAAAEARRETEAELQRLFKEYRDPDDLFVSMVPRAWQTDRSTWTEQDGTRHIVLMVSAPSAEIAEINGWLSEGLRLHIMVPKPGSVWRADGATSWVADSRRRILSSYSQSEALTPETVLFERTPAAKIGVRGTSSRLREPETGYIYHLFTPQARAVVEVVAPGSKVKSLGLVAAIFEATMQIRWTK